MQILIIGASGYIGCEIYNFLKQKEYQVIGTRFSGKQKNLIHYDILYDSIREIDKGFMIKQDKYAIICTADARINYCYEYKEDAYAKNVTATIKLINELAELKYHIIFLSSDNVFDGVKGNYTETDRPNPINEYGKMKLEVENHIHNNVERGTVLRLSKTIGDFHHKSDVFREWYWMSREDKVIQCIKGNVFSPIYVRDISKCVELVLRNQLEGTYHLSGNDVYERVELCRKFFEVMDLNAQIAEKPLEQFSIKDRWPLNVSMCNEKFINEMNFTFTSMQSIIEAFKSHIMTAS